MRVVCRFGKSTPSRRACWRPVPEASPGADEGRPKPWPALGRRDHPRCSRAPAPRSRMKTASVESLPLLWVVVLAIGHLVGRSLGYPGFEEISDAASPMTGAKARMRSMGMYGRSRRTRSSAAPAGGAALVRCVRGEQPACVPPPGSVRSGRPQRPRRVRGGPGASGPPGRARSPRTKRRLGRTPRCGGPRQRSGTPAHGDHFLVYGAGPIGPFTALVARLRGTDSVMVVKTNAWRRTVVAGLGLAAPAPQDALSRSREESGDVLGPTGRTARPQPFNGVASGAASRR